MLYLTVMMFLIAPAVTEGDWSTQALGPAAWPVLNDAEMTSARLL
jgi:hypothetical protein